MIDPLVGVLVGVRSSTSVGMFVKVEVVVIEARANVVVDSLIDVITGDLTDAFIEVCADTLVVEDGVFDQKIMVVAAAVVVLVFAVPASCTGDVLDGIVVGMLVNTLTNFVDALTEVNANVSATVITVEIRMPARQEMPLHFF